MFRFNTHAICRPIAILTVILICAVEFPLCAQEASPEGEKDYQLTPIVTSDPALTIELNDASLISTLFSKNQWFDAFLDSNLYRGVAEDLGPVFFMLGENLKNAWSGRLIDFLSGKLLTDEPIHFYYFARDGLVSPIAAVIPNLNESKTKVLTSISEKLLQPETKQEMLDLADPKQRKPFRVRPLHLYSEKFASYRENQCLALSRDPRVAISSGGYCSKTNPFAEDDVVLRVQLDQIFPQVWSFVSKFYGFEKDLIIKLKYKAWDKNFRISEGLLKVREGFIVPKGKSSVSLFDLLPAQTVFFTTFMTPFPENLDDVSLKSFLASSREEISKKPVRPATLALWKRRGATTGSTYVTAVLIQDGPNGSLSLDGIPKIFPEKSLAEIKFDRVCDHHIVVTPYLEALEDLRQGCIKNIPVLSHKNPRISESYGSAEGSSHVYFDLGLLLTDSLRLGVERSKDKNAGESPEVAQSLDLLGRLPVLGLRGAFENGFLKFEEVL